MVVGESHHWMETPKWWSNLRFGSCQGDAGTLRSTRWPADRLVPGAGAGSRWGWIIWKDLEEIHGNPIRINQFSRLGGFKSWYFHPQNWGRWTHFDQYFSQSGWFNHQLDWLSTKHNAEVKYGDASYYENCEPCQRTIEVCSSGVVFADQEQRHQRLNLTTVQKPISFG